MRIALIPGETAPLCFKANLQCSSSDRPHQRAWSECRIRFCRLLLLSTAHPQELASLLWRNALQSFTKQRQMEGSSWFCSVVIFHRREAEIVASGLLKWRFRTLSGANQSKERIRAVGTKWLKSMFKTSEKMSNQVRTTLKEQSRYLVLIPDRNKKNSEKLFTTRHLRTRFSRSSTM